MGHVAITDSRIGEFFDSTISESTVSFSMSHGGSGLLDCAGKIPEAEIPVDLKAIRLELEPECHHLDTVALCFGQRATERVCTGLTWDIHQPCSLILRITPDRDLDAIHSHHLSPRHGVSADLMSAQVPGARSLECIGMTVRHFPHWTMTCEPR